MKTLKKVMALLLAVLMVTALFAGCAKNPSADTTTKGNDAADTTTKGNDAADTTAAADEDPVKLVFMTNVAEWPEDSIAGEWERKVEEACNVEIEWQLPAGSAYEDNLQLMLLDDEKPDAVIMPDNWRSLPSFIDACKNGTIMNHHEPEGSGWKLPQHHGVHGAHFLGGSGCGWRRRYLRHSPFYHDPFRWLPVHRAVDRCSGH